VGPAEVQHFNVISERRDGSKEKQVVASRTQLKTKGSESPDTEVDRKIVGNTSLIKTRSTEIIRKKVTCFHRGKIEKKKDVGNTRALEPSMGNKNAPGERPARRSLPQTVTSSNFTLPNH